MPEFYQFLDWYLFGANAKEIMLMFWQKHIIFATFDDYQHLASTECNVVCCYPLQKQFGHRSDLTKCQS